MMARKVKRAKKGTGGKDAYGFKKIATKGVDAQAKDFMKTVKTGKMGWVGWNKI
jgi:hypothetical protein